MWNFKGNLWNSTQNIFPIQWKISFLYKIENLRAPRIKSSWVFLKRPPGLLLQPKKQGAVSIQRWRLTSIGIPMFKIRRSRDRLIISPVSEGSGDVMVLRQSRPPPVARRPPPAARNGVNAITQKPRDGLFSNLVYTLVVIVSWPD